MKKTIRAIYHLAYRQGYEQAERDAEARRYRDNAEVTAYRKGRIAEAQRVGDTRRAADLMGGADE